MILVAETTLTPVPAVPPKVTVAPAAKPAVASSAADLVARAKLTGVTSFCVAEVATGHGVAPAVVATAWLLQRSPVMVPIPGTSKVAHARENIAAAWLRLSVEDVARLNGAP